MKKLINPYVEKPDYNCMGCNPRNPIGLHLEFWEDGDDIVTEWSPSANHQGWIDTLHGGIIAMLIDEIAGWVVNRKLQTAGMTTALSVKYLKPVHVSESKITLRAHIVEQKRNFIFIHITLYNSQGEICDEADATYYAFNEEEAAKMKFSPILTEDEVSFPYHPKE